MENSPVATYKIHEHLRPKVLQQFDARLKYKINLKRKKNVWRLGDTTKMQIFYLNIYFFFFIFFICNMTFINFKFYIFIS